MLASNVKFAARYRLLSPEFPVLLLVAATLLAVTGWMLLSAVSGLYGWLVLDIVKYALDSTTSIWLICRYYAGVHQVSYYMCKQVRLAAKLGLGCN